MTDTRVPDELVRATEKSRGGLKYELVLQEPCVQDPPRKEQLTSPPRSMSVQEIQRKLQAAEDRRLLLEAEKLQAARRQAKLEEASAKRQEHNNNFVQSAKEQLQQRMGAFESNREAKLRALQEKLREHEKHIEEVRQSKNLNANDNAQDVSSG